MANLANAIRRWILRRGSDTRMNTKRSEVRSRNISIDCHEKPSLLVAQGPRLQLAAKKKDQRRFRSKRQKSGNKAVGICEIRLLLAE